MRFLFLATAFAAAALALVGCSSDDPAAGGPAVNACVAAGGRCQPNFPYKCAPGTAAATESDRASACGKSEDNTDIPCCMTVSQPDTGAPDTSSDTGADAGDASSGEGGTDAATDAASDGATSDAATDASSAG